MSFPGRTGEKVLMMPEVRFFPMRLAYTPYIDALHIDKFAELDY